MRKKISIMTEGKKKKKFIWIILWEIQSFIQSMVSGFVLDPSADEGLLGRVVWIHKKTKEIFPSSCSRWHHLVKEFITEKDRQQWSTARVFPSVWVIKKDLETEWRGKNPGGMRRISGRGGEEAGEGSGEWAGDVGCGTACWQWAQLAPFRIRRQGLSAAPKPWTAPFILQVTQAVLTDPAGGSENPDLSQERMRP